MTPLVSIITVTYDRPEMLRECVDSVRAQTVEDWEHLITDDGSPGEWTRITLIGLQWLDKKRLRPFQGEHLDRPAMHWNRMVQEARGKYITILDDDNLKHPRFIEVMAKHLDAFPEVDVVTCGFVERAADGTETENLSNLQTRTRIAYTNTVDTNCWLARREALASVGPWPEDIRTNEDWWFMRRVVERLTINHLATCLVTYRTHGAQRMHRRDELGNEADKLRILTGE